MKITVRLVGPFSTGIVDNVNIMRYRIKNIHGAVTVYTKDGEKRPGNLLDEVNAKELALDYDVTTEEYTG